MTPPLRKPSCPGRVSIFMYTVVNFQSSAEWLVVDIPYVVVGSIVLMLSVVVSKVLVLSVVVSVGVYLVAVVRKTFISKKKVRPFLQIK